MTSLSILWLVPINFNTLYFPIRKSFYHYKGQLPIGSPSIYQLA
jgi:hypothetical protein